MKKVAIVFISVVVVMFAAVIIAANKKGLVEYVGAQKEIFKTGKATSVISLETVSNRSGLYAIGPIDDLDGEITIFDSKPYITKVRGAYRRYYFW